MPLESMRAFSPRPMRCLAIVPFLNEAAYMGTFLASLDAQTRRPDRLILVDDGSTDRSAEIADRFAERPWATVMRRPPRPPGKDRLVGAPELAAFLWAAAQVCKDHDVLVKMDADLRLAPTHFERVMTAFADDPRLGMAGVYLSAMAPSGRLRIERHPVEHVRGATRFYRRECFDDIQPIPQILGWDGADEVRARARGWRTRSLPLGRESTLHLRPTGSHDGRLRARARWGACAYAVGAHPVGVLAAAVLQARQRPWVIGGLAYGWGWLDARRRGLPRAPLDIRRAKAAEQRLRLRAAVAGRLRAVGVRVDG
jgi:biofilm PGA synthesis N-glycosyltransferase PgaC